MSETAKEEISARQMPGNPDGQGHRRCFLVRQGTEVMETLTPSSQLPLDHSSQLEDGPRLNAAFDYLENVPNIAATVCDKEGIVLYQNKRAIDRDGEVVGKNLYNCHGEKAAAMIRHMIESGDSNTYQIIRHGKHKLLHQTPWYDANSTGWLTGTPLPLLPAGVPARMQSLRSVSYDWLSPKIKALTFSVCIYI